MNPIRSAILIALAVAALLGGCGGSGPSTPSSGGSTSTPAVTKGKVTVTVHLRAVSGLSTGVASRATGAKGLSKQAAGASSSASGTSGVPLGAQSVQVAITDLSGNPLAQPQIIGGPFPAPAAGNRGQDLTSTTSPLIARATLPSQTVQTVTFNNIPAGSAKIQVTAYNNPDANLPAVGTTDPNDPNNIITVNPGQTTFVTPVITSTAALFAVTYFDTVSMTTMVATQGQQFTVNNAATMNFTATLLNSQGQELVGSPIVWSSSNSTVATISGPAAVMQTDPADLVQVDPATVTVTIGFSNGGSATIEARDPNSGATFDVIVMTPSG